MAQPTFVEDVLPPEGIYQSRESLLAAINSWARPRGYAFTTGKSTKDSERPRQGGVRMRSKQTTAELNSRTNTPDFESKTITHQARTHLHTQHIDGLKTKMLRLSQALPRLALPRGDIRTCLDNHLGTIASQRDIYNRIAATRRDLREGQSSIHALVDQLHREGFWCRVRLDPDSRLNAIFFAHPESVAYLQYNPDVLLLDCTYRTNNHRMPLLDMVGVDSCQRSFCIAFAFLSGESEEDYSWALEHLRSLYQRELPLVILTDRCMAAMNAAALWFPSFQALLYLWDVNKAVLLYKVAGCKALTTSC